MITFRRLVRYLLPTWLRTGEGDAHTAALATVLDAFYARAILAAKSGLPAKGPDDALAYQSRDRKITRGINETAAGFAARLIPWLDNHRVRGNAFAMLEQLRAYCNVPGGIMVRAVDRRGNWYTIAADGTKSVLWAQANWTWDTIAASPQWARGWVIIYPNADGLPWAATPKWGDGGAWGDGRTWGTTATPGQVADVRAIVREWKPGGTRCEWIIVAFNPASFNPAAPEPDGTWDRWGKGSPHVKNRLATARYWKGTGP